MAWKPPDTRNTATPCSCSRTTSLHACAGVGGGGSSGWQVAGRASAVSAGWALEKSRGSRQRVSACRHIRRAGTGRWGRRGGEGAFALAATSTQTTAQHVVPRGTSGRRVGRLAPWPMRGGCLLQRSRSRPCGRRMMSRRCASASSNLTVPPIALRHTPGNLSPWVHHAAVAWTAWSVRLSCRICFQS